jgi:hypothetical protein
VLLLIAEMLHVRCMAGLSTTNNSDKVILPFHVDIFCAAIADT